MKLLRNVLAVLLVVGGVALALLYPRLTATRVQSPFEAAALLEQALRQGQAELTFRTEEVEPQQVYRALESLYPYAFSVHSTTRPNGTVTMRGEVSRAARQRQAQQYAHTLAETLVTPDMDERQMLRALHDGLVRLCQYDTATADSDAQDGATAPFAADGALLDHRAVCAGYGRAYALLCEAAGLRAIYIASEEMNHGWNAVRLDGVTYFIDCTFDDPVPDRGEYVSDYYFLQPAAKLAETHTWDTAFYEQVLDGISQ